MVELVSGGSVINGAYPVYFYFDYKLGRLVRGSSVINGDTPSIFLFIYEDRKFSYQRKRSARDLRIHYNAFSAVVVFVPDMTLFYRFRILTLQDTRISALCLYIRP